MTVSQKAELKAKSINAVKAHLRLQLGLRRIGTIVDKQFGIVLANAEPDASDYDGFNDICTEVRGIMLDLLRD